MSETPRKSTITPPPKPIVKAPRKPLHEYPEKVIQTELFGHSGLDSFRRNALQVLDERTLLAAAGNCIFFIDTETRAVECVQGPEEGGVGAIAVHPDKSRYVVCDKQRTTQPMITGYNWPERTKAFQMRNGAVLGFSACAFNDSGSLLATVAVEPDYAITLWDWKQEKVVLRSKAFGSDVFRVQFSPFNEGMLATSGMGHIKFWVMAETFTGLKLQGDVGKFGRVEISDVADFAILPDGKVASSSENGSLLLWEGNLIKCELKRIAPSASTGSGNATPKDPSAMFTPCHKGPIEIVRLIESNRILMTAGHDGYVRYWSAEQVDLAEAAGTDTVAGIRLIREYHAGDNVVIRSMTLSADHHHWFVQDGSGAIIKVPYWTYDFITSNMEAEPSHKQELPIMRFNSGAILCVVASPTDHTCITGGEDGTVRLYDYIRKSEVHCTKFGFACVKLQCLETDKSGKKFMAGFADGSVRILEKGRNSFQVVDECRPHPEAIIDFALDSKNEQLYTIGKEGAAFYIKIEKASKLLPVGYCKLPGKALCTEWNGDRSACMIGFDSGCIIALRPPDASKIDTNVSFEFEAQYAGVGFRQRALPPPKEKLPGQEEDESSDEEEEDEELKEVGPWAINFIRLLPQGTFLVGTNHKELCYEYALTKLYEGAMGPPPLPPSGYEAPGRVEEPIRNLAYRDYVPLGGAVSHSREVITVICENGRVLVRNLNNVMQCAHIKQYHDGIHGIVHGAVMSFDDRLVLTVGNDGMLFVQSFKDVPPPSVADAADILSYPSVAIKPIAPIARCVQDAKNYDDKVRAEEAAQSKKDQRLRRIRYVHDDYEAIIAENEKFSDGRHIPKEELVLDPELSALAENELKARVAEAAKEYEWTCAKKEAQLSKLRSAFIDNLECDRFALHAFNSGVSVYSLRVPKFTAAQQKNIEAMKELLEGAEETEEVEEGQEGSGGSHRTSPASQHSPKLRSPAQHPQDANFEEHADPEQTANKSKLEKSAVKSQLEKAEERKRERIERTKGFQELLARKPKANEEDAKTVAEIAYCEKHMGDYLLKTSPDYVMPEHARPTAERKAKQLILLEHSVHQLRSEFNQRLVGMRDLKKRLCESINADKSRIKEIGSKLHVESDFVPHALQHEEEPEKRFAIDRAGLEQFEKDQEKARKRAEAMDRAKKGFGADLAAAEETTTEDTSGGAKALENSVGDKTPHKRQSIRQAPARRGSSHSLSTREKADQEMKERMQLIKKSELEEEELAIEREQLLYEKSRIERRIAKVTQAFDDSLFELYIERMKLDADLCMADMRVLLLFREFQLLVEFRKKDEQLTKKLDEKKKEKHDIVERSRVCSQKCNQKFDEIEALKKRAEELAKEFQQTIVSVQNEAARKSLEKIYWKRIKRIRKNEAEGNDDDDLSSSDDDDEEEEDDFVDDGEEEICPPHCDEVIFKAVLALRERRLDQEEALQEFKKSGDVLNKEYQQLRTREDAVNNQLKGVEKEIHQFQTEKQKQLNQLETIVVLKLSQIQCLTGNDKLPYEFTDNIVVFTQSGMQKLKQTIMDLAVQKIEKRKDSENLVKDKARLQRKKSKSLVEFSEWEQKVYEVQLLKFGQRVDLEMLENVAVDRETEELKAQLKIEELKWEKELMKETEKVLSYRSQQQQRIVENTTLLKDLGSMRAKQQDLEDSLQQSTQKIVAKMSGGSRVATAADRAHLKDLVVAQQQEIDALKNEIAMLRRKGGHVYTPVVNKVTTAPTAGSPPAPPA